MLKIIEAFAGVGSQKMALRNIGIEHESVGIFEIDIDAIISYGVIHHEECEEFESGNTIEQMKDWLLEKNIGWDFKKNKSRIPRLNKTKTKLLYNACYLANNFGDISKADAKDIPDHDLFTYSFPCQDISLAGLQKGFEKGSSTKSSLLWECERIIREKQPKYLMLENVKNLVGNGFIENFKKWLTLLNEIGYVNYWQVLNATDYVIPQNRERVFVVSIRKDINQLRKPYNSLLNL